MIGEPSPRPWRLDDGYWWEDKHIKVYDANGCPIAEVLTNGGGIEGFPANAVLIRDGVNDYQPWIPCADRLPADDRHVLVAVGKSVIEGFYESGLWFEPDYDRLIEPTHWKPKPEPPT
jgi:hypothetical protein